MKNILIVAGPSAVGKTTIVHRMLETDPRYELVRSVTTRPCRGDQFNNEYIYITEPEFQDLVLNGGVLEHTEYAGNFYGTPRSEIDRISAEGRIPLLILDINGVCSLSKNKGDISPCGVYIYDDIDVMDKRLYARYEDDIDNPETKKKFDSRSKQNIIDYTEMPEREGVFHALVKNCSSVDNCAERISSIFARFCEGEAKDAEKNSDIAKSLADSVRDKI